MAAEAGRRSRAADAAADPGFPALKAAVIARTGHHYYADKDDLLFDRLAKRFRATGYPDAKAYAALLEGPDGAPEWAALEAEITIGETFFFRYAEQFTALRTTILPELIAAQAPERRLRIWSAGCSTGAEPYSVAILVHELLGPALPEWTVTILGTDLNAAALATARKAEYGRWALRTTPVEERRRWFREFADGRGTAGGAAYRLKPEFRSMVRFERQNLIGLIDGSIPASFGAFDLILCRNVLIYFSAETVAGIVHGLGERLRPGGWLLVGHAEPNPAFAGWLTPVQLPGTAAYQRWDGSMPLGPPPAVQPIAAAARAEPSHLPPEPHGPAPDRSAPPVARAIPPAPAAEPPAEADEDVLGQVRRLADAGRTAEAWRSLRSALGTAPTDARLRFYEGLLALDLGREAEAEKAFRGALFLDRDFVMAHYHLGLLLGARGRDAQARRALDNALLIAQGLEPELALPEGDGVTAGEMVDNLRLALARLP